MRIFNEETREEKPEVVFILKQKEVGNLIEALEEAFNHRPRKKSWKNLLDKLEEKAGCF